MVGRSGNNPLFYVSDFSISHLLSYPVVLHHKHTVSCNSEQDWWQLLSADSRSPPSTQPLTPRTPQERNSSPAVFLPLLWHFQWVLTSLSQCYRFHHWGCMWQYPHCPQNMPTQGWHPSFTTYHIAMCGCVHTRTCSFCKSTYLSSAGSLFTVSPRIVSPCPR